MAACTEGCERSPLLCRYDSNPLNPIREVTLELVSQVVLPKLVQLDTETTPIEETEGSTPQETRDETAGDD